ncbi:Hypothetical protein R9X50_00545300 [Acrodontium crateriforme]|uniref:NAD(P)-binding domain-containing protein n=1 Tax=Acrodontium crateriforme TaxID=150365 RepID=A0AAQ3M9C4_9PEZI|nr:Hypothetical protein R9X50_00545300 [Acrodontium crateriforme]
MAIDYSHASDSDSCEQLSGPTKQDMAMMRIAIAGTSGLARLIAHYINQQTSHHVVFLSRRPQPELKQRFQVAVVDYNDMETLQYALRGIDTVISTVTGTNQIELIKAAVSARVRRFAPAEFEGLPQLRASDDPLDRHRTSALQWLAYYAQNIQSTVFICGILYERFQPGGLAALRIGRGSGIDREGDYIMNCRTMTATVPCYDENLNPTATVCMTAAQDVARFVTKAIDMPQWPPEMRMCGHRIGVKDLVILAQRLRGVMFNPITWHNSESLRTELQLAITQQDDEQQTRLSALISTAEGHYDYQHADLNQRFPDLRPIPFPDWFVAKWRSTPGS